MLPQSKLATMIVPQSVASDQSTTGYVDTKGFDYATINLVAGTCAADKIPTVLRLGQSDTTPTAFTDTTVITNFVGGTETSSTVGFVIPTPVTTTSVGVNTYCVQMGVDLRGKKRFLALEFNQTTTQVISVDCSLSRGGEAPIGTTKANVLAQING